MSVYKKTPKVIHKKSKPKKQKPPHKVKSLCEHKKFNHDLFELCPDCGISEKELLIQLNRKALL